MRASWASGLGCVPEGYTTYATNAVEASHKGIKHLMGPSTWTLDLAAALTLVGQAVESRVEAGLYSNLKHRIEDVSSSVQGCTFVTCHTILKSQIRSLRHACLLGRARRLLVFFRLEMLMLRSAHRPAPFFA